MLMTEAEWLACEDLEAMLEFLRDRASERKFRLFACASCRSSWPLFEDNRSRTAIEAAECYADGRLTEEAREQAHGDAVMAFRAAITPRCREANAPRTAACAAARAAMLTLLPQGLEAAARAAYQAVNAKSRASGADFVTAFRQGFLSQIVLLRDIVGNPFRPAICNIAWRTTDAMLLAQGIYDDRAFDRMPILADALQDAGCESEDMLNHCRDTQHPHVRGCWVVDLVLGKA
jgi:hypothetical protein